MCGRVVRYHLCTNVIGNLFTLAEYDFEQIQGMAAQKHIYDISTRLRTTDSINPRITATLKHTLIKFACFILFRSRS